MSRLLLNQLGNFLDRHPDLGWKIRLILERLPRLNLTLLRVFYSRDIRFSRRIVSPQSTIVIEGFPRSANSFCCRAFIIAQANLEEDEPLEPDEHAEQAGLKIATHVHSSCQLLEAARLGVPAILLVRSPVDAISSWRAFDLERSVRTSGSIKPYIQFYLAFHSQLLNTCSDLVLVTFEQATQDFGQVIDRVNQKYDTRFHSFDHTPLNLEKIRKTGSHVLPSAARDQIKATVREQIKMHPELIQSAQEMYERLVSGVDR